MYWTYTTDIRLKVKRIVPDEQPPKLKIVLLHDALGSIHQWKAFPEQLSTALQAEVILYDRQGHGASSPKGVEHQKDFFHQEALEVLPKFLEDHQLQDAIIMGHSDGGTIALLYAAHFHPKAVITIAPHIFIEEITLRGIRQAITVKTNLLSKLQKYHANKTEALFDSWANTWTHPHFRTWNIQKEIKSVSCPLLLLQGEKDEYGSARQLEGIQEVVPHAQIRIVSNLGHLPHLEAPKEVLDAIQPFLIAS